MTNQESAESCGECSGDEPEVINIGPTGTRGMSLRPERRRRFLWGFFGGLILGGFVTPPMMLVPGTGELLWLLQFAIPVGLIAALLPVGDPGGKPGGGRDG